MISCKKIFKNIKKLNFIINLLKAKLSNKYIPLFVLYNITNRCNLRCCYCFGKYYERQDYELSTKEIFYLIDQLAIMGTKRLGIGGGEPLLRNDIGYILEYLKKNGIESGINTNGILLPQKISELSNVDTVCISLDGEEDVHDYYRGKGTFKKAMMAIEYCRKYKIETHASMVLTKNNVKSIGFLLRRAKELGFLLQISPLYSQFYGYANKDYPERLENSEYKQVIKDLINLKKDGWPIFYSQATYRNILNWPDYRKDRFFEETPNFKFVKCYAGKYFCHIEPNGDVYPCAYTTGHSTLNCLKKNFYDAFRNINMHPCKACLWACYIQFNLLFDLNLNTLESLSLNFIKKQGS